ncbi:MAG: CehA/McbA family metallohydrolase, partial [Candidatus Acidiferrum sp.]
MKQIIYSLVALGFLTAPSGSAELPLVDKVELQPLAAQAKRIADALDLLGSPLAENDKKTLADAGSDSNKTRGVRSIQVILDKHCLAGVVITPNAEHRPTMRARMGPALPELAEQGWRVFLVKVHNPSGIDNMELRIDSPNSLPLTKRSSSAPNPKVVSMGEVGKRFLDLMTYTKQPLARELSGLELEYRILQVYCRDAGRREAELRFSLGKAKSLVVSANPLEFAFASIPAVLVRLHVRDADGKSDHDGRPVVAAFTFTDYQGRIYPAPSRRLAPDFNFHFQVYRADGEAIALQPGEYTVS